jgi:hypothetical protein
LTDVSPNVRLDRCAESAEREPNKTISRSILGGAPG